MILIEEHSLVNIYIGPFQRTIIKRNCINPPIHFQIFLHLITDTKRPFRPSPKEMFIPFRQINNQLILHTKIQYRIAIVVEINVNLIPAYK